MASWDGGYVTDIQYTSGFYRELSPTYLSYICDLIGVRSPDFAQPYTYCELGCGQGFGTNLLAAANPGGEFYAYDFNPAQIANAQSLAKAADIDNVHFFERSFQELAEEPYETQNTFDVIVLHGVISWISQENFQHIITFIKKCLNPGGLVYVSYNALPGWAIFAPLQKLISEYAKNNPCRIDQQLRGALNFAKELHDAGAGYFTSSSSIYRRISDLSNSNATYAVHEYLNQSFTPFYFSDIVKNLDRAKVEFAGSAHLFDNFDIISVPEKVRSIISRISDPVFVQTIRDYAINQQFRRDIFIRGINRLGTAERKEKMLDTVFQLFRIDAEFPIKFSTPLGEVMGKTEIYEPIVRALEGKAMSIGELSALPSHKNLSFAELSQTLALLVGRGYVHPVVGRKGMDCSIAQALNRVLARRMLISGNDYNFLSTPAIGSAIPADMLDMCLLSVIQDKTEKPNRKDIIEGMWNKLEQSGRFLMNNGNILKTKEDIIPHIEKHTNTFLEKRFALWKTLCII